MEFRHHSLNPIGSDIKHCIVYNVHSVHGGPPNYENEHVLLVSRPPVRNTLATPQLVS